MSTESLYDIVCVGFGPAALAMAIVLQENNVNARVIFLEKQSSFGWHTGMLISGAKMQISFLKDLACMRNPRSHYTFINYLHQHNRLAHFANLSTHTPLREEFNDYLKWCASHFDDWVRYGCEVVKVSPFGSPSEGPVSQFKVLTRDLRTSQTKQILAKHVVVACGGQKAVPRSINLDPRHRNVIHSSQYLEKIARLESTGQLPERIAIIGGGQSAAEICEDLSGRLPGSNIRIIIRDTSLRPSDDSPFVNEIFDPTSVDEFYSLDPMARKQVVASNKATNYGVVRIELLEKLYERIYRQRVLEPDESKWQVQLVTQQELCGFEESRSGDALRLHLKNTKTGVREVTEDAYDLIVLATGYSRAQHVEILDPLRSMLAESNSANVYPVARDYQVKFQPGQLQYNTGIWLQGCCESSHGLSDSLLSNVGTRGGELVNAICAKLKSPAIQARL